MVAIECNICGRRNTFCGGESACYEAYICCDTPNE